MKRVARVDLDDFKGLFGSSIRTLFNWEKLMAHHDVEVGLNILDRSDIGGLHTPWYSVSHGGGEYQDGLPALTVDEVVSSPRFLTADRWHRINLIGEGMRHTSQALLVATYRTDDGAVLLDGNHRLVAAVMYDLPVSVLDMAVYGPRDVEMLPDLANLPNEAAS